MYMSRIMKLYPVKEMFILVDGCSSVGMIMQADRTPNYIASPNFPEAYPR